MSDQTDLTAVPGLAASAEQLLIGRDRQVAMERRTDGIWRYEGTDIAVPGAIDRTLGEIVDIREVGRRDKPPEAVLVKRSEIDANPALGWVKEAGKQLRGDDEDHYEVSWPVWQERAVAPVGVWAPECDGAGLSRLLAMEERELRFARRQLELLTEKRARTVAIASGLGMSRRQVGELLGLSTGRIQQIIEDVSPMMRTDVNHMLDDILTVLREIGPRTIDREEAVLHTGCNPGLLDELAAFGLLEQKGSRVEVTEAGENAELHLRTKKRRRGGNRG